MQETIYEEKLMPGITLVTVSGINDGTVEVMMRASGKFCPRLQNSLITSNAGTWSGVKAGEIIEAHFLHD
jgi:hypothetical protein